MKYVLINVNYKETYPQPVFYTDIYGTATGSGEVSFYYAEAAKWNSTADIEQIFWDSTYSDMDYGNMDEAKIYEDNDIAVYLTANASSVQSIDFTFTDSDEEYISAYEAYGSILIYKKSDAGLGTYKAVWEHLVKGISAKELASYIVTGDVADVVKYV